MITKVTISEHAEPQFIRSTAELESVISQAVADATERGCPNVIFFEADNGNILSLVVGAAGNTAVGFANGHDELAYYMSKGEGASEAPALTATVTFSRQTELQERWLVPWESGVSAAYEFVVSGELPKSLEWIKL